MKIDLYRLTQNMNNDIESFREMVRRFANIHLEEID